MPRPGSVSARRAVALRTANHTGEEPRNNGYLI